MSTRFVEESLTLDVYILGYRTQGESIILIVKSDGVVRYTCVIDCYEYNEINKTMEILSDYNISYIDLFCWTHPDLDHSIGIDCILSEYANNNTKVLIPKGLGGKRDNYKYNERVQKTFELIKKNIKSRKNSTFNVTSVSDSMNLGLDLYEYTKEKTQYIFDVKSVAPSSNLILRREQFHSEPKRNDYSIALHFRFGDLELFFGGDIENVNIDLIIRDLKSCTYFPDSFHLLKIPHHTSCNSDHFLQLLNVLNKSDLVCSTVYRSSKLPEDRLINLYRPFSRWFLCTGHVEEKYDYDNYGCIHINFDILQKRANIELSGNANTVFENNI